jgi:hypothetical protein
VPDPAGRAAREFLAAAYPDERKRDQAQRWLGLLARQAAAGDGQVRWWETPAAAPAVTVLALRWALLGGAAAAAAGWGLAVSLGHGGRSSGWYLLILVGAGVAAEQVFKRRRRSWRRRPGGLRPRAPRAAGRPGATSAGSYRAARGRCLLTGLAAAPAGALLGWPAGWGTGAAPAIAAAHALAAFAWGALLVGPYPLVKLSELVMSAAWEERVRFLPLLEDAAGRGVLRPAGAAYQFGDDALLACLAASGEAALAELTRRQEGRLAGRDVRAVIARGLTRNRITRVSVDGGLGTGGAVAAALIMIAWSSPGSKPWVGCLVGLVVGALAAAAAAGLLYLLLTGTARGNTGALANLPLASRRSRLLAGVTAVAVAAALVALAGPVLAKAVAFLLPAALVAACGGWACALARRRTRSRARRWQRAAPDAVAVVTVGCTVYVLADHRLLTAAPAAGLLFPVAGWGAFLVWRAMGASARVAVKAAADLVFALLLGGELVLLLVWLANVLAMPRGEVAALRAVLGRAGELADLPWWAWTGTWLALAAASLAFIRWPARLKQAAQRFQRWQVVTAAEVTERALTGIHIGLLALVFVGLTAPPALTPLLSRQLRADYDVAFQRELRADGEVAAYTAISRQLADQPRSPVLIRLVSKIHEIGPPADSQQASATERDNARRAGEAEAIALALAVPPSLDPTVQAAADAAGQDGPPAEPSGLTGQAAAVQSRETTADDAGKRVEAAADLAAKVVASLVSVPSLSDNEVFQVVREYLAGLIEDSPLKDTFAAWIARLPGAQPPPDAAAEVVPVPARLEQAATAELSAAFSAAGAADPVTDPLAIDPALLGAQAEDPLDGAVDLVNQARYAQQDRGPCTGCAVPGGGGESRDEPQEPHEERPFEP